mgnify:CR=1 FL=1
MFGASNPQQALHQLENYHREGRLERAEVLASDMTDRLMMLKERDGDTQTALVKGLRLLSSILNDRSKFKRAQLTVKLLHKQRNKLGKMVGHDLVQAAEDYRLAGCINANYGKKGAAKRAFAKCEKMQPGRLDRGILFKFTDAFLELKCPAYVIHSSEQTLPGKIVDLKRITKSIRRLDFFLFQIHF